jgi:hypothetical protein
VARAFDLSRQAIQLRLKAAVEKGDISPERVAHWQSMTSRAAAARERRKATLDRCHEAEKLQIKARLTPENLAWLRRECVLRKATTADVVNGLITKARLASD